MTLGRVALIVGTSCVLGSLPGEAIVQFGLLFYLLQRFLWGPVTKALDARAQRIREGLDNAEAAKRERTQMQVEVERLLNEARREASAIAERTTQAAEAAAAEIRTQAKDHAFAFLCRGTDPDGYWQSYLSVGGAIMPSYSESLSAEERWHVVNYVRTLASK